MLRSLYSGISGLRAHQTALDVTGNNISNVNTTGFKSSSTQFQDTLSQVTQGSGGPQVQQGGRNPAQIGLGVKVAGITTNFTQGANQATGRSTDMLVSGTGFFIVRSGNQSLYTRAGSFDFDGEGRLVTPGGGFVQGWPAVNGVVQSAATTSDITLPQSAVNPAVATSTATVIGNLPGDAVTGTVVSKEIPTYSADGTATKLALTFTKTADGWDVTGANGDDEAETSLTFTDGALSSDGELTVGGIAVDLSGVTGFARLSTVSISKQNGHAAGTLESFSMGADGTLSGLFSNGQEQVLGRITLANFVNPSGLEKAGGSNYRATSNSGVPELGYPGDPGFGALQTGVLEMSNVDLSQEFTNLIVAQRGFQANARIITTSDEVLQELTNLKR
jgi:flagellar hook protein FlgE